MEVKLSVVHNDESDGISNLVSRGGLFLCLCGGSAGRQYMCCCRCWCCCLVVLVVAAAAADYDFVVAFVF